MIVIGKQKAPLTHNQRVDVHGRSAGDPSISGWWQRVINGVI